LEYSSEIISEFVSKGCEEEEEEECGEDAGRFRWGTFTTAHIRKT
jgi:hypothetical protein